MVKFSPTALNFGYDYVLLVHFLGHPVYEADFTLGPSQKYLFQVLLVQN